MTFGSLFAGIGGFDLGLERAGMTCKWQVEIDPFCRRVLAKHWPDVPKFEDVREVGAHNLERVDLICGGFPCQDISPAGKRAGIDGKQSRLWAQFERLVGELRPRFAVVENSADLLVRGMGTVCGGLAAFGYNAEWQVVSACAFGAPHLRERVYLVAYPESFSRRRECGWFTRATLGDSERHIHQWATESQPDRVADGVSHRTHRRRLCGNAVVPQIAEWLGRRILEADRDPA